jgi:hypothetical protein
VREISAIGRCHGFTGRPNDPYCYHPGPGILPVWASDLVAWIVVLLFFGVFFYGCWRINRGDWLK